MTLTIDATLLLQNLLIFLYSLRLEIFDRELMSEHERFIFRFCRYSYRRIIVAHLLPRVIDYVLLLFGRHGHPLWIRGHRVPIIIVIIVDVHYDFGPYDHHNRILPLHALSGGLFTSFSKRIHALVDHMVRHVTPALIHS